MRSELVCFSYSVRRELGFCSRSVFFGSGVASVKSIVGDSSKLLSICTVRCSCEEKLVSVIRLFMVNVLLSRIYVKVSSCLVSSCFEFSS